MLRWRARRPQTSPSGEVTGRTLGGTVHLLRQRRPGGQWYARTVHARGVNDSNRVSSLSEPDVTAEAKIIAPWRVSADGGPCRWGESEQGEQFTVWGEAASAPKARARQTRCPLRLAAGAQPSVPRARPRQRHRVSGVHCLYVQPLHPPDHAETVPQAMHQITVTGSFSVTP